MPAHYERIRSVIDELPPDTYLEVSHESEIGASSLSQGLESHYLSDHSSHDVAPLLKETGSQSSSVSLRDVTPETSVSLGLGWAEQHLRS